MPPRKNRNRRNREAVDPMANCVLPPKIIVSILSRLPVKSLVRFKGVCKQWQNLVTNQEFIKLHYTRFSDAPKTCSANSQILDFSKIGRKKKADVDDQRRGTDFFLAPCKGLICVARPLSTDRIILWNPATRLWKVLPHPTAPHKGTTDILTVGFGCNEEGDDHKVVWIHCMKGKKMKAYVDVYSSKLDTWKTVNAGLVFRSLSVAHVAEVSGNLHWVVRNQANEMCLLRFDSTKMLFEMIRYPSPREKGTLTFVDLGGYIGALQCVKRSDDWLDKINVIAYVNDEWIDQWSVQGGGLRDVQVKYCLEYSWRKRKIVGQFKNGGLFEYDVREGSVRVFGVERSESGYLHMHAFEESLAHVRGMAALDLAMPAADGDGIKDCVSEGFVTGVVMHGASVQLQVYYPLAF